MEYRVNRADKLINTVDNESRSNRIKITEAMISLRELINEHEDAILRQISTNENEQKKQLEDYKTKLNNELQNVNMQKVAFEMLISSKDHMKLLQSKQRFDDYVNNTNGTLKSLSTPTATEYCLQGLDQLENLKEKIAQCGQYVQIPPYCNPQLEQLMTDNRTAQTLNLSNRNLTDLDMQIVANVLRKSKVGKSFIDLLFPEA